MAQEQKKEGLGSMDEPQRHDRVRRGEVGRSEKANAGGESAVEKSQKKEAEGRTAKEAGHVGENAAANEGTAAGAEGQEMDEARNVGGNPAAKAPGADGGERNKASEGAESAHGGTSGKGN